MKLIQAWLGLIVLSLTGCLAPLEEISFSKDSNVTGTIRVKVKKGGDLYFQLEDDISFQKFNFQEVGAEQIDFSLFYQHPQHPLRVGEIRSSINLRTKNKKAKEIEADLTNSTTLLSGKRESGVDCKNLFNISTSGHRVHIQFNGFQSFATCTGKVVELKSPTYIGRRNLNRSMNFFSEQDDAALGKEFTDSYLLENNHLILDERHSTSRYIQNLLETIAAGSDRPDIRPQTFVINADVLNAFALPGGYVFVFRGLVDKAENESQLAGVLGHEWAHVTSRHGTEDVTRSLTTIGGVLAVTLGILIASELTEDEKTKEILKLAAPFVGAAVQVGGTAFLMNKGRAAETEADILGAQYAWAASFNPIGLAGMFSVFKREFGGGSSFIERVFSSHPEHDTRIENITQSDAFFLPYRSEAISNREEFVLARSELLQEPIPQSAKNPDLIAESFAKGVTQFTQNLIERNLVER